MALSPHWQDDYHLCLGHKNPRWWYIEQETGLLRRRPCRSPKCRSVWCRWGMARKESICLSRNFDARAALYPRETWHFVVLKTDFNGPRDLANIWASFRDRLKYKLKDRDLPPFLYYHRLEFDRHQRPHIHLLTTTLLPKRVSRNLWSLSCGLSRTSSVYWEPVASSVHQCAAYIVKARNPDKPEQFPQPVPKTWSGKLTSSSHCFWIAPRSTHWSRQLDEWYPDRPTSEPKHNTAG